MHDILSQKINSKSVFSLLSLIKRELLALPRLAECFLKTTLLIVLICVLVPLSPKMPAPGLDASWALGLNQAVAQGLLFGKQILFTLGPYSSIYTKAYHPSTDLMMIGGSLFLACSYWFSILLLMKGIKWRWPIALGVALFGMMYARDSLFFSYPLLVGLASFKIINSQQQIKEYKGTPFLIALLFAPFGLLPLIKGSLLILCIIVVVLCCLFFSVYQKTVLTFICLITPIITMALFWFGAGQSIIYLPSYISGSLSLASAFTQAMAIDGSTNELILYLIASILILFSIASQKSITLCAKIFLLCLFFVFLFLSFKTGFTRHFGHAYIAGTSILIAALLVPFLFNSRIIIPIVIFSVYTSSYIDGHYTQISLRNNFLSTYTSAWHGLNKRLNEQHWLSQNFALSMYYLKAQASFPVLEGTTDIYSYNQAYLIASQLTWSPRPIFQSYSVFTATQAEQNKQHLLNAYRPDNIIFRIEPIDGRIPSLEDGASWPLLITQYQPTQLIKDFLFLHTKNTSKPGLGSLKKLKTELHILGETIPVPQSTLPLFVELDIKPTFWGLLSTLLFKPDPLNISIELNDGNKKEFRINANMAKSGFLLSPLIENTNEFALMYTNKKLLDPKKVKSFVIVSRHNKTWDWHNEYLIHFKSFDY
jgi:hypothetical protein